MRKETIVMRWKNTLMAYEKDIKDRSFWDWMKAHTFGFKPLHRYEGVFELDEDQIIFDGNNVKEGKDLRLEIPIKTLQMYILDEMRCLLDFH